MGACQAHLLVSLCCTMLPVIPEQEDAQQAAKPGRCYCLSQLPASLNTKHPSSHAICMASALSARCWGRCGCREHETVLLRCGCDVEERLGPREDARLKSACVQLRDILHSTKMAVPITSACRGQNADKIYSLSVAMLVTLADSAAAGDGSLAAAPSACASRTGRSPVGNLSTS